jgi:hypothetical protein
MDGRFDMYGDFAQGTVQPTVWYIEGLAEYLSLRNDNQTAIDVAKTGTYKLSTIFQNTYSMADYVTRAYRWGYMAVRFMNERHRADLDAILPMFRAGNYDAYEAYMQKIGTSYDAEFAAWVQTATTAGDPPLPGTKTLPPCGSQSQLGNGCAIYGMTSGDQTYAYFMLPSGATNLKLWTSGGTGDVDLYLAANRYPTTSSYDFASTATGNAEQISVPWPKTGNWYYVTLKAKQPFANVALSATYDTGAPTMVLPACSSSTVLSKHCSISNLSATSQAYAYITVPAGARNLRLWTTGGTGDADLLVGSGRYPTTSSYDFSSRNTGNSEMVNIATPESGKWYYIVLNAKQAFSGLTLNADYDQ